MDAGNDAMVQEAQAQERRFLEELMAPGVGKHTDAFLKRLAMSAAQTRKTAELLAMQAELLKEQARVAEQREALVQAKAQLSQGKRSLTLEKKRLQQEAEEAARYRTRGKRSR